MDALSSMWQQITNMQWQDVVDILIVAFLIYQLIPLIRSTGTMRIAGIAVVAIAVAWIATELKMHMLSFILNQLLTVGLLALVVLFQPELRRMLEHLSHMKLKRLLGIEKPEQEMVGIVAQTVRACEVMSRDHIGALIVFARTNRLEEYFKTGTMIDGQVSEQLIRALFYPKAALHDGAVIVRDGKVAAAGCVLPLSASDHISADLGTRHRAGLGTSEVSDAVVVIVSEETGAISVAVGGMLKRHLAPQTLEKLLRNELCTDEQQEENLVVKLRQKLMKKEKEGGQNEK